MLGSKPLKEDASLRDFNGGIGCHVTSVLEESLLLPKDITELRGLRKNEVFLNAKRYLGMTVQATFRLEEMTNSYCQQFDDERKRQASAVQTLTIAEQSNVQLKKKLVEEEHAQKSADSALENTQRQAEDQRKCLPEANDQLTASKEQITTLKKQLEEAQRLKDQAKKAKAEAEKAKSSSELRRPKNVYFPPAIRVSNPPSNQKEAASTVADSIEEAQTQNPLPLNQQEQPKILEVTNDTSSNKVAEASKEEAVSQSFEQALALTILPAGEVPKEKEMEIPPKATDKAPKSKLQIKLKP
ncbi:uncharacterized protein LOC111994699 [Quercus suber]|uniref:uncharacterized protein LOC111994699 n=1 Tax=Quercus suber TaxID=58331 RepID=UPI000CE1D8E3|nr:plectin-like [Quercus suber]